MLLYGFPYVNNAAKELTEIKLAQLVKSLKIMVNKNRKINSREYQETMNMIGNQTIPMLVQEGPVMKKITVKKICSEVVTLTCIEIE